MTLKTASAHRKDINTAANGVTLEHRHFAFIASTIATMEDAGYRADVAQLFADACRNTNAKFDRQRFMSACRVSCLS